MAFLSSEAQTFTGGCLCSAIRYTISVPALLSRNVIHKALPTPINAQGDKVDTRFPFIFLDHCQDCRRASGAPLQCWFICPQAWVEFELQLVNGDSTSTGASSIVANPAKELTDATYLGYYNSSTYAHRCFCRRCGTPFSWCSTTEKPSSWNNGDIVDIAVGTFDQESLDRVEPDRHGWWDHGTEWIKKLVSEGDRGVLIRHPHGRVSEQVQPDK